MKGWHFRLWMKLLQTERRQCQFHDEDLRLMRIVPELPVTMQLTDEHVNKPVLTTTRRVLFIVDNGSIGMAPTDATE
jgi:hypothetical protein